MRLQAMMLDSQGEPRATYQIGLGEESLKNRIEEWLDDVPNGAVEFTWIRGSLTNEAKDELRALTPHQREIVLNGLNMKLGHYESSGHLSYRYDICPVCQDVGSTEEDEKCDECYIKVSCKLPFVEKFRDDPEMGARYFDEMLEFLMENDGRG